MPSSRSLRCFSRSSAAFLALSAAMSRDSSSVMAGASSGKRQPVSTCMKLRTSYQGMIVPAPWEQKTEEEGLRTSSSGS